MTKEQFLAFSLPFKLVCQVTDQKITKLAVLGAVYVDGQVSFFDTVESNHGFSSIKPVLRPLSEADSIIRTQFSYMINDQKHDQEVIDLFCSEHINTSDLVQDLNIEHLPFDSVMWLIRNHFDIGCFVEKGEAIETNELPSFSYY